MLRIQLRDEQSEAYNLPAEQRNVRQSSFIGVLTVLTDDVILERRRRKDGKTFDREDPRIEHNGRTCSYSAVGGLTSSVAG